MPGEAGPQPPDMAASMGAASITVAHLTTVASSLRYLLHPQLTAVRDLPGTAIGISALGSDVDVLAADGIAHVALSSSTRSMNPLADLKAAVELWRILRRERVDVLHTHNPKPGLYGRVVGRLARVPIVVNTNHGLYATDNDRRLRRVVVLALEAVAARFSHRELIQNPEDFELLTRWRLNSPRRTTLLGNGIDLQRFLPNAATPAIRADLRAELGADDETVVVGMVGRLVVEKGYRELAAATSILRDRYSTDRRGVPRYRVVAIGPYDPEKADALGHDEMTDAETAGLVWLGHRDDVDALYRAMDLFVLPSHREGFPRAAMEAAASGLPIVATNVRGCRQVVDDGVTGLLVRLGDANALADAIAELGEDRERRLAMGKAAAARAREQFDEREVVRIVLDTYAEVAARKGRDDLQQSFAPNTRSHTNVASNPSDAAASGTGSARQAEPHPTERR